MSSPIANVEGQFRFAIQGIQYYYFAFLGRLGNSGIQIYRCGLSRDCLKNVLVCQEPLGFSEWQRFAAKGLEFLGCNVPSQ